MSTWVLILTLAAGDYRHGPAIHSVPGFGNQAECVAAAAAWTKQMLPHVNSLSPKPLALCVEQRKERPQ
jgi:hypothetical protein